MEAILVIIGSALEGVIYGALLSVALTLLFRIIQAIAVAVHNGRTSNLSAIASSSQSEYESRSQDLKNMQQESDNFTKDIDKKISVVDNNLSVLNKRKSIIESCLDSL